MTLIRTLCGAMQSVGCKKYDVRIRQVYSGFIFVINDMALPTILPFISN